MTVNSNFSSLESYNGIRSALSNVGGPGAERVLSALDSLPPGALSRSERQAVQTLTGALVNDGDFSPREAKEVLALVAAYRGNTFAPSCGTGPFSRGELGRYAGNVLYASLAGSLASLLGGRASNVLFRAAAESLLDNVRKSFVADAVSFAFRNADLSRLNSAEKSSLLTMLAVATADGMLNNAEASAMLLQLDKYLGAPCYEPGLRPPRCDAMEIKSVSGEEASIDLGDGYSLKLNASNSELLLINQNTGTVTKCWGDPHFDVNGQRVGDFKSTITLVLENGVKITINTVPWVSDANQFLSSQLTITKGDQLIQVRGLDQNRGGDLSITESNHGGRLADWRTSDGLRLYENPAGGNWLVRDGCCSHALTQTDFDLNDKNALIHSGQYEPLALLFAASLLGFSFGINTSLREER